MASLALVLAAFLWRLRWAGRLWGAAWDILPSDGAMHPIGLFVNWLAGAFSIGVGWHTLRVARGPHLGRRPLRLAGVAFILLGLVPFLGLRSIYSPHFTRDVVELSNPVIVALEDHRIDQGEYPPSLDQLVPRYLPSIPSLGYGARRELRYYRADTPPVGHDSSYRKKVDSRWTTWVGDAPYALVVERVPAGTMVYRPRGEHSALWDGHRIPGTKWFALPVD